MLKKRIIRFIVSWIMDQINDETLELLNEAIDAEIEERENG